MLKDLELAGEEVSGDDDSDEDDEDDEVDGNEKDDGLLNAAGDAGISLGEAVDGVTR